MEKPRVTARIAGHAQHPLLCAGATIYFAAVLACDLLYTETDAFDQVTYSVAHLTEWMLGAGLLITLAAAVVALIDFFGDARFRALPDLGTCACGGLLVLVLQVSNLHLRLSEGTPAIAPMGTILSLSAMAVLLALPSQSWARMYR